jgi:hypothetical protein
LDSTIFRKLEAGGYVEEDVVGFWLDMLVLPEVVVLLDASQKSVPLSSIFETPSSSYHGND